MVSRRSEEELRLAHAAAREQASASDAGGAGAKVRRIPRCACQQATSLRVWVWVPVPLQASLGPPSLRFVRSLLAGWRLRLVVAVDMSGADAAASASSYAGVVEAFGRHLAPFMAPQHACVWACLSRTLLTRRTSHVPVTLLLPAARRRCLGTVPTFQAVYSRTDRVHRTCFRCRCVMGCPGR